MTELVLGGVSHFVGADFDPLWLGAKGQGIGIKMRNGIGPESRKQTENDVELPLLLASANPLYIMARLPIVSSSSQEVTLTTQFNIATATQSCRLVQLNGTRLLHKWPQS